MWRIPARAVSRPTGRRPCRHHVEPLRACDHEFVAPCGPMGWPASVAEGWREFVLAGSEQHGGAHARDIRQERWTGDVGRGREHGIEIGRVCSAGRSAETATTPHPDRGCGPHAHRGSSSVQPCLVGRERAVVVVESRVTASPSTQLHWHGAVGCGVTVLKASRARRSSSVITSTRRPSLMPHRAATVSSAKASARSSRAIPGDVEARLGQRETLHGNDRGPRHATDPRHPCALSTTGTMRSCVKIGR